MMLEDELAELAAPDLHEQVRLTPEEQQQLEADAETEQWGLCVRCGEAGHYARECSTRPAHCPDFQMPRVAQS